MTKNRNMGRKSHLSQDAEFEQNVSRITDDIGEQPTRPTIHKQQATKSSKPNT
jgi:hypothetical protein